MFVPLNIRHNASHVNQTAEPEIVKIAVFPMSRVRLVGAFVIFGRPQVFTEIFGIEKNTLMLNK